MVRMAELAPCDAFDNPALESGECPVCEEPYVRHYDDYTRNWEDAA